MSLKKRGFGSRWLGWMEKILHNGYVGAIVNNREEVYFETGKGLRQGDPLSPMLFSLVVDVLTRMLKKAVDANLIKGLATDVAGQGVIAYNMPMTLLFSCKVKVRWPLI